jgi:dihydrofolate reductase
MDMPLFKLFIATSIDGFIARENGSIDWLNDMPNPDQLDYGYGDFIATIDVILMGRKTYEEVLGFGVEWPYGNCKCFIVTSKADFQVQTPNTSLLHTIDEAMIQELRSVSKKNTWIVGGGELITAFINCGAIDAMTISLIPILLGKGIRLFPNEPQETLFDLIHVDSFGTCVVNMNYVKRDDDKG